MEGISSSPTCGGGTSARFSISATLPSWVLSANSSGILVAGCGMFSGAASSALEGSRLVAATTGRGVDSRGCSGTGSWVIWESSSGFSTTGSSPSWMESTDSGWRWWSSSAMTVGLEVSCWMSVVLGSCSISVLIIVGSENSASFRSELWVTAASAVSDMGGSAALLGAIFSATLFSASISTSCFSDNSSTVYSTVVCVAGPSSAAAGSWGNFSAAAFSEGELVVSDWLKDDCSSEYSSSSTKVTPTSMVSFTSLSDGGCST